MSKKIENKIIKTVDLGKTIQYTTQVYKPKGQTLNHKEVTNIINSMRATAVDKKRNMIIPLIKVMNGEKVSTYKDFETFSDYYEGAVEETDKFHKFLSVQITTIMEKPKFF